MRPHIGGQPPMESAEQRLPMGKTCSHDPNMSINIKPSQKTGTALKTTASTRVRLSNQPALADGGENANRHADGETEQERGRAQLQRRQDALADHVRDRALVRKGATKITPQNAFVVANGQRIAVGVGERQQKAVVGYAVTIRIPAHPIIACQPTEVLNWQRIVDAKLRRESVLFGIEAHSVRRSAPRPDLPVLLPSTCRTRL